MTTRPPNEPRENRTPMAFLPYQARWAADTSPVKVCEKSRRIGLSWGEAGDTALLCSRTNGMDAWYIGYTKDMAEEFIRDCADFARMYDIAASDIEEHEEVFIEGDEKKSILTFTIRFASGYRVTALSSSPRNLRGKQGRVIIDEAAFHSNLAELLKAALALLIWGGEVHIISTHDGADNPFNELVEDIRAGKVPYSLHRITFMDAIEAGLYERVCLRTGKPATAENKAAWIAGIYAQYRSNADEELDCIPKRGGGAWLPRTLIEARMGPGSVIRWKPPAADFAQWPAQLRTAEMNDWMARELREPLRALQPTLASGFGMDFGRLGDLSVFAPFQIEQSLRRKFPFLVELAQCPFDQQREFVFHSADRLPRFSKAALDARGNGHYLAEVTAQRYGWSRIDQVMLSEAWYREHTAPFKAAFEDDTIWAPADADVVDDLRAFEVIRGVPRLPDVRTSGASGTSRHGDAGIALLLGHYASRHLAAPIEFMAAGRRDSIALSNDYLHGGRNGGFDFDNPRRQ